jgi:hypothetical protein
MAARKAELKRLAESGQLPAAETKTLTADAH